MMTMKCNFCALLFLALLELSYPWWSFHKKEQSNSNSNSNSQFDYLKLVFVWPNSFCNVPNKAKCIPPVPQKEFVLHGLWPEKDTGGTLENCSKTEMPDETLEGLKKRLVNIWPALRAYNWEKSKEFYKKEWSTHGTCSESKLGPKEYLETALDLASGNDRYSVLKNNKPDSIVPHPTKLYFLDKIKDAVHNGVKKWPDLKCNRKPGQHGDENQLYEIHLCYRFKKGRETEKLVRLDCYGDVRCGTEIEAYYPNTDETTLSHVPSKKELVSGHEDKAEL